MIPPQHTHTHTDTHSLRETLGSVQRKRQENRLGPEGEECQQHNKEFALWLLRLEFSTPWETSFPAGSTIREGVGPAGRPFLRPPFYSHSY